MYLSLFLNLIVEDEGIQQLTRDYLICNFGPCPLPVHGVDPGVPWKPLLASGLDRHLVINDVSLSMGTEHGSKPHHQ